MIKRLMPLLVLFLVACGSGSSESPSGSDSIIASSGSTISDSSTVIPVVSITLSSTSTELKVGETATLTSEVLPADATDKSLSFTSSDDARATVSSAGVVTAVSVGEVTILATSNNNITGSIVLNIIAEPVEKTLTLTGQSAALTTTVANGSFTADGIGFTFGTTRTISGAPEILMINKDGYLYNTTSLGDIISIKLAYATGGSAAAVHNFAFGAAEIASKPDTFEATQSVSTGGTSFEIKPKTSGNSFFRLDVTDKNLQVSSIIIKYK